MRERRKFRLIRRKPGGMGEATGVDRPPVWEARVIELREGEAPPVGAVRVPDDLNVTNWLPWHP
jgi:hypothetical protein